MSRFVTLLRKCLPVLITRQASRADLIALDSPFLPEPAKEESADADFKAAWDSMENANIRGWCEASLDLIVRLLQSLEYRMRVIATDQPPFEGACGSCEDPFLTHLDLQAISRSLYWGQNLGSMQLSDCGRGRTRVVYGAYVVTIWSCVPPSRG